jgi:hypothetical protein
MIRKWSGDGQTIAGQRAGQGPLCDEFARAGFPFRAPLQSIVTMRAFIRESEARCPKAWLQIVRKTPG